MANLAGIVLIAFVIFSIIGLLVNMAGLLSDMGLGLIISALIGGGIGFAVGNLAGLGWAIFGAVLGSLVGIAFKKKHYATVTK
jgi:hypothetical protein